MHLKFRLYASVYLSKYKRSKSHSKFKTYNEIFESIQIYRYPLKFILQTRDGFGSPIKRSKKFVLH